MSRLAGAFRVNIEGQQSPWGARYSSRQEPREVGMTKDEVPDHSPGCSKDTREEVQEKRSPEARCVEAGWDLVSPGCSRGQGNGGLELQPGPRPGE